MVSEQQKIWKSLRKLIAIPAGQTRPNLAERKLQFKFNPKVHVNVKAIDTENRVRGENNTI